MRSNNKYTIIQELHNGSCTILYRAIRVIDKKKIIIKVLKQRCRDAHRLAQFKNEKDILSNIDSLNIVKFLQNISTPELYCNIFEDIGADTLDNFISESKFNIYESLNIAYTLTKTLNYLHKQNIIHADINPKNIIYKQSTKHLQIIDFGLSIQNNQLSTQNRVLNTSGNLYYISPEQTGLVHSSMDSRSDIYSLGMSLYHLFYGKHPFNTTNKNELIHQQIAKTPIPLHKIIDQFPKVLSDIIQKMISKIANNRYQNTNAIVYDLKKCIDNIDKFANISSFSIASLDHHTLLNCTKIFGRKKEITLLKNLAKSVNYQETINLMISGSSGLGKTSLIENFFTYFDSQKFLILRAKIDQYQEKTSFLVFKQLFIQLNAFILSNNDLRDKLNLSKNDINILISFFPELKELFFKQKEYILKRTPNSNNLYQIIKKLFNMLSDINVQFIIFIDDLQWIDEASSMMIKNVFVDISNPYIHLVLSFRDKELSYNDDAIELIQVIKNRHKSLSTIKLSEIDKNSTKDMIESMLYDNTQDINQLSSAIYKRTEGNPYFVKIFIQYLYENKILIFTNNKWQYSLKELKNMNVNINIATILISKFNKLNKNEQKCLQYLTILGNSFDLNIALKILNKVKLTDEIISKLIKDGFIEIFSKEYKFVHDKIQEYIFLKIDENQKQKISLNIGNYLLTIHKQNQFNDIIIITNHLNNAYPVNKLPKKLFKLNLQSLELLLSSNSYKLALKKLNWIDNTLLKNHEITFYYESLKVRTYYLNTKLNKAFSEVDILVNKANSIEEKTKCFKLLKNICVTKGEHFHLAIDFGNKLLKELGLSVPISNNELYTITKELNYKITKHKLMQTPNNILKLKSNSNDDISPLLVDYWELAYYLKDTLLMKWCYLNIIEHSFKKGNNTYSSFAYALYGSELVSQKEYTNALIFGNIALKLNKTLQDKDMLPKINNFVANFINPYKKKIDTNIKLYKESLEQSKINGDIIFGTWANFLMFFSEYLSGNSLEKLRVKVDKDSNFILESGDTKMIQIFKVLSNAMKKLRNDKNTSTQDEDAINLFTKHEFYPAMSWYAVIKAQDYFLNNQIDSGIEVLKQNVHSTKNELIMFAKIRLHFIRALLFLSKDKTLSDDENELLKSDLLELENIHKQSPNIFRFEKLLLKVESIKRTKNVWDVAKEYDKAIDCANTLNNQLYISLANLCAGRFWKNISYMDTSAMYYNEAVTSLRKWGAFNLSNKLDNYLNLLKKEDKKINLSLSNTISSSSYSNLEPSNFSSVLESLNAISKSLNTDTLIQTLLKIILQNAIASKAVLILEEKNTYIIKASITLNNEGKVKIINKELIDYSIVPKDLIFYSINTGRKVLLNKPAESMEFRNDKYIKKNKPYVSLVIPIKLNNLTKGVLYIQNDELLRSLNNNNIKTLELLLTQTAIILNNTSLYEEVSLLSQAISQNPHSTIITDKQGTIEYVNTQTLNITKYTKDDLIGRNMNIFNSGKQNSEFYKSFWKQIFVEKSTFRGIIINRTKSNQLIDLDTTVFPIFNKDKDLVNFVAIQEDITQQRVQEEIYTMQSRQAQMGEMISMIAHQWRQPLSIINTLVTSQRLSIDLDSFDMKDLSTSFKEIEEQVLYLSSTINDFRDFFKPTKKTSFTKTSTLIDKTVNLIKHSFNVNNIKIDIKIIKDTEYKTFVNELQQVILNILKNAQDVFTERDIKNPTITITIDKDEYNSIINIEDNAKGIDEKVIDTLFLPYVSTKNEQNGTGLGLYMSKTIIDEHCKGRLSAINTEVGARFIISIPLG